MVPLENFGTKPTPPPYKLSFSFFSKRSLCFTIASNEFFLCRLVPGYVPWVYGNNRGFNSFEINWSPIPEEDTHGVLLGYVVYFKRYLFHENFSSVKVNASTRVLRITGLLEFTTYEIKVAGRTSVGEGPSNSTYVSTGWYLYRKAKFVHY